ncbi:MAG: NADH-quinone oxidoreductase subunit C [Armatimonadetes bacterium]|nr:NADH-quinone oxidoreductase subunit C [Armatimonadota bacterium]
MSETSAAPQSLPYEDRIRSAFPDAVTASVLAVDTPTFTVDAAQVLPVCRFAKEELGFNLPVLCSAVDRLNQMEVVWHAYNTATREFLAVKTSLPRDDPHVASATAVWRGMDWHEREAFDLMGIFFEGHPDLRRILLPDDWEGHPLRKDYTAID